MERKMRQKVIFVLVVNSMLKSVSGTGTFYPQFYQQQGQQLGSYQQTQATYPQYQIYNGGFSSSTSFLPIHGNTNNYKLIGKSYAAQQPIYQHGQVIQQEQHQPYHQYQYPTTSLNAINVKIVPKGEPQPFHPPQQPQPIIAQPIEQQSQNLAPLPSPAPIEPTITKVTYLSSVATLSQPAPILKNKSRRLLAKSPETESPNNFSQFYNLRYYPHQQQSSIQTIQPQQYSSNNQALGGTSSPFLSHVSVQYQQQSPPELNSGRSVQGNAEVSGLELPHPKVGSRALVLRPNGVEYYDPNRLQYSQQGNLKQDYNQEQNQQFVTQINSNSLTEQFTPSTPYNPLPTQQTSTQIPEPPQQYAPQQQGFQPSAFPSQQLYQGQQFQGQNPFLQFPQGQGQPPPFPPGAQGPPPPFPPGAQGPPPPFPPGAQGSPPFPPGQGGPPFEELENGYNPNFLQAFPEPPYQSEFANEPPLPPQDEVELEAYRTKNRRVIPSRRRNNNPQQQPQPIISQGSDNFSVQSTPPPPPAQNPLAEGCVYKTEDGKECVEVKK